MGQTMGKSWENHGKIMGKIMGKSWQIMGKSWENMGKSWENHGKIMGKSENHGNCTTCTCVCVCASQSARCENHRIMIRITVLIKWNIMVMGQKG